MKARDVTHTMTRVSDPGKHVCDADMEEDGGRSLKVKWSWGAWGIGICHSGTHGVTILEFKRFQVQRSQVASFTSS